MAMLLSSHLNLWTHYFLTSQNPSTVDGGGVRGSQPGSRVAADRATWWRPATSPAGPPGVSPQGRRQSVDCGAVSRRAFAPLSALAPIFEPPGTPHLS